MAIYLVQHGKALSKEQDPERGLSVEGRAEAQRAATAARALGLEVTRICHSGKKRARETAETFAAVLNPPQGVAAITGISPNDDVAPFASGLDAASGVMVIGHLPFLDRLAALLVNGNAERPVCLFHNAGVVALDRHPATGGWVIRSMVPVRV